MASNISVDVAAEKVMEDDSSDSHVHSLENNLMKSENCSDDISRSSEKVKSQLPHVPSNKECIPVDTTQITVRAKRGRKRKKEFTRSENKKRRNCGLSYISTTHKFPAKKLRKNCYCKRLKCNTKISEQRRQALFNVYWELGDINKQRQFIVNCVSKYNKERKRTKSDNSRRNSSLKYFFCIEDVEVEVCKIFFLNTLSISETTVTTALKKGANGVVEEDNRGKTKANSWKNKAKRNDEQMIHHKNGLRQHILSFPQVPSHYCRSSSNFTYLSSELTLSKMYELYKELCNQNETQPLSYTIYWQTFQSMNLSFHCPKKDWCETCEKFRNLDSEEQEKEAEKFQEHRQRAEKIYEIKTTLKQENDRTKIAAVFGLQKALPTPKSEVSLFYYSQKLSTYNFSISDLTNDEVTCFVWNETISGQGSNEIGSCLFQMLKQWDANGAKEVNFFSDTCPEQNWNWDILALFHAFVNIEAKSIKVINHYFFESGHSQNENDSVHTIIERAARHLEVFIPEQWYMLIRSASKKKSYKVNELDQSQIYDFADVVGQTVFRKGTAKVSKMQIMSYKRGEVLFSYSTLNEPVPLNATFKKVKSIQYKLINKEASKPIQKSKKKDLLNLCQKLAIPKPYHGFYQSLKEDTSPNEEQNK